MVGSLGTDKEKQKLRPMLKPLNCDAWSARGRGKSSSTRPLPMIQIYGAWGDGTRNKKTYWWGHRSAVPRVVILVQGSSYSSFFFLLLVTLSFKTLLWLCVSKFYNFRVVVSHEYWCLTVIFSFNPNFPLYGYFFNPSHNCLIMWPIVN